MLINSKYKVKKTIEMELFFDDGVHKKGEIKTDEEYYLVFRRNHRVHVRYGIVKDIIDRYFYRLSSEDCRRDDDRQTEVAIKFDASRQYKSEKYTIPLSDIIDFEKAIHGINPDHRHGVPLIIYKDLHKE